MNEQEKNKIKTWWAQCPNQKLIKAVGIILAIASVYCIYELGYGLGKFIAHIGF